MQIRSCIKMKASIHYILYQYTMKYVIQLFNFLYTILIKRVFTCFGRLLNMTIRTAQIKIENNQHEPQKQEKKWKFIVCIQLKVVFRPEG